MSEPDLEENGEPLDDDEDEAEPAEVPDGWDEPDPAEVPDDWLDPKPSDPAGR